MRFLTCQTTIERQSHPVESSDGITKVKKTKIILGEICLMAHPDDLLYVCLVGKSTACSFIRGRKLPIVADTYAS